MLVYLHQKKKRRESQHMKFRTMGDHEEFLQRISKTLCYSKFPLTERFSLPLSELAVELYSEVKLGRSLERLRIEEASEISRNACISPCSLVLAVIYLEQLKTTNSLYVDKAAPSELFLISLMVASKFLNDNGEEDDVLNSEWAASANLSLSDVNRLEKEFLSAIEWKVFVKDEEFWKKLRSLETMIALSEGKKRGWFSYTEIELLLDKLNAFLLAQAVFTISAVCLASYAAGMLTVIGSTMVVTQLVYVPSQVSTLRTLNTHVWQGSCISSVTDEEPDVMNGSIEIENCSNTVWLQKSILHQMSAKVKLGKDFVKENASEYGNFFIQNSFYLMDLEHHWKEPLLYIASKLILIFPSIYVDKIGAEPQPSGHHGKVTGSWYWYNF